MNTDNVLCLSIYFLLQKFQTIFSSEIKTTFGMKLPNIMQFSLQDSVNGKQVVTKKANSYLQEGYRNNLIQV